jgi:hypothetical protein
MDMGMYKEAESDYSIAIQLDPKDSVAYLNRSSLYRCLNRLD